MPFIIKIFQRVLLLSLGVLLAPHQGLAQFSKLDDLGSQIAKELKHEKNGQIAVADFRSSDGKASPQGHYFAWYLSGSIQEHGKKLKVIDHLAFDANLSKLKVPAAAIVSTESFRHLAPNIGADVIVLGVVGKKDSAYVCQITLVRVSDGVPLFSKSTSLNLSEFLESLIAPARFPPSGSFFRAGVDSVGMPKCIQCPDPPYNDLARRSRIQGVDVFELIVSADGVVQYLRAVKLLGYGLDEEAYNTIKKWKFKPATEKDGTPVAAVVPVEVTFRLY